MITFGFITEGRTDQIVIDYILNGYFDTNDIDINELQPELDETDNKRLKNYGGWTLVFNYCKSNKFKQAFQFNDYIIIQIDTDVCEEKHFDISKRDKNGNELKPTDLIENIKDKFKNELIGEEFFSENEERIIFAISVHSIECWLLPLYFSNNKKAKTVQCLRTLNEALGKKEKFTIDAKAKNPIYYEKIAKQFLKRRKVLKLYKENPSLNIFIEELEKRKIVIEKDDDDF